MNPVILTSGAGKYEIKALVTFCGQDLAVIITGGKAHIGAAALAVLEPSLTSSDKTAIASVLCVNGHRENELARKASLYLATECNASVLVSVGLHLDAAKASDIEQLVLNTKQLVEKIGTNLMALR